MNANIIAHSNPKGGVGKNDHYCQFGHRTCSGRQESSSCDFDPHASLTINLGYLQLDQLPVILSDLMGKVLIDRSFSIEDAILHHDESVDRIPSYIELSGIEVLLVNALSREQVLQQVLDHAKKQYDYILIDCIPSLDCTGPFIACIYQYSKHRYRPYRS